MKRTIPVLAALLLSCSLAAAAPRGRSEGPPDGPPPPPPPQGLGFHLEMTIDRLTLDDARREAVDELLDAHRDRMEGRREEARAAHDALRAAVTAPVLDEPAIRAAAARVAEFQADGAVADATLLRDVRALLDRGQRARLDELLASPPPPRRGPPPRRNQ